MKLHLILILTLVILLLPQQSQCAAVDQESTDAQTTEGTKTLEEEVAELKKMVAELGRQAMLNQLYLEERVRSDGDSGLKQVRHVWEGTKTYHSDTHSGWGFAAIHDHFNYINTLGMGETVAVMNGVEFRTRHNDYKMVMPSDTSEFGATVNVPFPDVPPEVLAKETIEEQIIEMREWFKAFSDQDDTVRDYKKYFKPALCYIEGMWTHATELIDESFDSERHNIDAETWFELFSKIRYQGYTGAKDTNENLAYLPRVVFNVTEDGVPQYAQWNYGIYCHPTKNNIAHDRLRVVDDLASRMLQRDTLEDYMRSHRARFQLNLYNMEFNQDGQYRHVYLDDLMYQIPGKNNYGAYLEDNGLEEDAYREIDDYNKTLNAAYYHRSIYVPGKDAMGQQTRFRGFADENLYVAMTTQDKVAGVSITLCEEDEENPEEKICRVVNDKVSYAMPLELIYLTPLSNWNPYNLPYKGDDWSDPDFKYVTKDGRNGTPGNAYNGTNGRVYHRTPCEFYEDTSSCIAVLDSDGVEHLTRPSGHYITFPDIPGVGKVRQRYPIAPIHMDGSVVGKRLEAVQDMVMDPVANSHLQYTTLNYTGEGGNGGDVTYEFETGASDPEYGSHVHSYALTSSQMEQLQGGTSLQVVTSQADGHTHMLVLRSIDGKTTALEYETCDSQELCCDGHPKTQNEVV